MLRLLAPVGMRDRGPGEASVPCGFSKGPADEYRRVRVLQWGWTRGCDRGRDNQMRGEECRPFEECPPVLLCAGMVAGELPAGLPQSGPCERTQSRPIAR